MLQNGQDILLRIVFFHKIAYAFCSTSRLENLPYLTAWSYDHGAAFNRADYYRHALVKLREPFYEHRRLIDIHTEQAIEKQSRRAQNAYRNHLLEFSPFHPKEENVFPFQEGDDHNDQQKYQHTHFRSQYCWANPGVLAQALWVHPDRDRACATTARRRVPD